MEALELDSNLTFVVSVSGGLTSFEAWRRCLEKYPKQTVAVFADVGSVYENGKCVSGEDEDTFRFLDETEQLLGQKIHRIQHPKYKNIWETFFAMRYVTNGRADNCSKYLKREILRKFVGNYPNAIEVLGYSWLESDRIDKFRKRITRSWFPLMEAPYVTNTEIIDYLKGVGIKPPNNYSVGLFPHNNCGGMCFKSGLGQVYDLWRFSPHRFEYNERMQEQFLSEISPHGTFLQLKGEYVSLKQVRLEFEKGYVPKTSQYKSCGGSCMVPEDDELVQQ